LGWFIEKFAAKAFEADIQKTLQSLKHTAEARYHGGVVEMPSI
jgi:hypothetical protein